MPVSEWSTIFQPRDAMGSLLPPEQLPLVVALQLRRPVSSGIWIRGLDGVLRHIEIFAFPLVGQADRFSGAIAIFWEVE